MRTEEMRAQDPPGAVFDEGLEAGVREPGSP
jgi:hypothetical protein